MYEQLGLLEYALVQYDELEVYFQQFVLNPTTELTQPIGMDVFGGTEAGDDSSDVLDILKKNYKSSIQLNSVTIFDFLW